MLFSWSYAPANFIFLRVELRCQPWQRCWICGGRKVMILYGYLFKWFEAKLESRWEIWSSGEMRSAYKEAMKYGGKVILGDRPGKITQQRVLSKMSLWEYLFDQHLFTIQEDILKTAKDELDRVNLRTQEMNKQLPNYTEISVYERDRYMAAKLLKVAREHKSVVAVVGMGHLAGIQENWKQPLDMKQLVDTGDHTFTVGEFLRSIVALFCHDQYMRSVQSLNEMINKVVYLFTLQDWCILLSPSPNTQDYVKTLGH